MTEFATEIWRRLADRQDGTVITICAPRSGRQDQALSGAELHTAAIERAGALLAVFDPAKGPLALAMPCGAEFIITLVSALYAGFTAVPLAIPRGGAQIDRFNSLVEDCRPLALLCSTSVMDGLVAARATTATQLSSPVIDVAKLPSPYPSAAAVLQRPLGTGARPAIVQYTSGSSRLPRGVAVHGENILANAALVRTGWGMDERQIMMNWLPHFHDMGLMGGILYPLLTGGRSFQLDPLHMIQRPARWLRLISDQRASFSGGPAFAFAHCLDHVRDEDCEGLDLSSWTAAYCGAEPVPAALMAAFRERFAPYGLDGRSVFGCYGMAEFTLMVAGGRSDAEVSPSAPKGAEGVEPNKLPVSMRDDVRVVDPETRRPVCDGLSGEIWLRGRSVAHGYINQADETRAVFDGRLNREPDATDTDSGPWLRTGDLGIVHDGDLYVTGRLKDVLIVNGRKIPAPEVEWLAAQQDARLNPMAAAALMVDELASGRAVLLIEMRAREHPQDIAGLRERIRRSVMGSWGIDLEDIRFLARGALPRTSSGKIRRRLAAEAFRKGEFGQGIG